MFTRTTLVTGLSSCEQQNMANQPLWSSYSRGGADPLKGTIGDRLPLHFSAENGHPPVVRILLQQPTVEPDKKDFSGQTALFKAASRGHHPVVELLLQQRGIDPDDVSNDGFTPLLLVIFSKHENVVRLLADGPDVNPNQHDLSYHQTPQWIASTAGDNILQMFLKREGVRIDDHSRRGETPLYQAIQRGRLSASPPLRYSWMLMRIPICQMMSFRHLFHGLPQKTVRKHRSCFLSSLQ